MTSQRRALFRACAAISDTPMTVLAARLGCTYNHLVLVLDGKRVASARLASQIEEFLRETKPLLVAALADI